ncbi:MAG TPA: hypothetical protein VJT71_13545 [Pyrinomonadaceae bacterium]|nr:hypothetical protein [Pyrinomonadaceae bacterium]
MKEKLVVCFLGLLMIFQMPMAAMACGPEFIQPIFVFNHSPDLPFDEFVAGKIGILRPTLGRKTLFVTYRYFNGGSFSDDERQQLVETLRGKAPEDQGDDAMKAWLLARKEVALKDEPLPEVYVERQHEGYDFFPNCARNAFEVATTTLKERSATYGTEDKNVRAWLAAQDLVFQNCQGGAAIPAELGPESPAWLRKDRDYQIGAALLYSLNFDGARSRFASIAADLESPWRETADYLVGRTLVRHASLTQDQNKQRELYEEAERHLRLIASRRGQFSGGAQKLLALVQFRWHPHERVRELASILANQGGNPNLKQDLIDYVWLLDKIENRIVEEEEKRKRAARGEKEEEKDAWSNPEFKARFEAIQRGELIDISWSPLVNGKPDHTQYVHLDFKSTVTRDEVRMAFASALGRQLTPDELKNLDEHIDSALKSRQYHISPNRRYSRSGLTEHEGGQCNYDYSDCNSLTLDLIPPFLRGDDLSEWIFAAQTSDPGVYDRAMAKWRESESPAWFALAISRAEFNSPRVDRLASFAEKIQPESPLYPTAAYNLVRLKIASGKKAEARKLLDDSVLPGLERPPVSARNQFLEQRMLLADNVNDFLKFAPRKAAAYYEAGRMGSISDIVGKAKSDWEFNSYFSDRFENKPTKEEYEKSVDERYEDLLPWDDRVQLDDEAIEILNWHFPLERLEMAARNPVVPDYLRRRLVLAVWTRAIVLQNDAIASRIAPEAVKFAPEMKPVFDSYRDAQTRAEKEHAALFVLLKFPALTPLVVGGIPDFMTAEQSSYDFETSWWCKPVNTEYDVQLSREAAKSVPKPQFLTPVELEKARRERAALIAIGDAHSYLGRRVLAWAKQSPNDPRIPEALYIAAEANRSYKYGCNGWDNDKETLEQVVKLLRQNYPRSPWTAKLQSDTQ